MTHKGTRAQATFDLAMKLRDRFRDTRDTDVRGWSAVRNTRAPEVGFPPGAEFSVTMPDGEYLVIVQRTNSFEG